MEFHCRDRECYSWTNSTTSDIIFKTLTVLIETVVRLLIGIPKISEIYYKSIVYFSIKNIILYTSSIYM